MKRALWIPIVAFVALATIAFFSIRGERAPAESTSAAPAETHAASDAADPARNVALSKAPPAETPPSRVETPPAAAALDTIPPPSVASSAADAGAPPPLVDLSTAASTTVETALTDDERAFFDKKYASASRDLRRSAREKLESFVVAQKTGTLEKSQVVSSEEILALRQEIAWLVENPSP